MRPAPSLLRAALALRKLRRELSAIDAALPLQPFVSEVAGAVRSLLVCSVIVVPPSCGLSKRRNGVAAVGAARSFQSIIRKSPSPCHSGSTAAIPAPSALAPLRLGKRTWFSTIGKQAELTAPSFSLG